MFYFLSREFSHLSFVFFTTLNTSNLLITQTINRFQWRRIQVMSRCLAPKDVSHRYLLLWYVFAQIKWKSFGGRCWILRLFFLFLIATLKVGFLRFYTYIKSLRLIKKIHSTVALWHPETDSSNVIFTHINEHYRSLDGFSKTS